MKNYPLSRKANLVVQEMEGETLVYDLTENKAFCLNETSALVWQLCDGKRTTTEIAQIISKKLKNSASEDLIWLAIDQLKQENLIENKESLYNFFKGMSRREIIKKVGMGSVIAFPLITSIIAPRAVNAQSGLLPENGLCTAASQCFQDPTFGTQCCTTANAPVSGANPRRCRAAGVGFNCI